MPDFAGVSHLDLSVSDVEASADWYCKALGMRTLTRADLDNRTMIVLRHDTSGLIIGLNQHTNTVPERFDEHRPGLDHVGFAVTERAGLDAWQTHFANIGVTHSPVTDAPSGSGAALVFRDPDNIQLEIWWSTPT